MNKKVFTLMAAVAFITFSSEARSGNGTNGMLKPGSLAVKSKVPGTAWVAAGKVFISNAGQVEDQHGNQRPDIDFKVEGQGVNLFIGSGAIHYQWTKPQKAAEGALPAAVDLYRMDVTLVNANTNAAVLTEEQQVFFEQYMTGRTSKRANTYKKVVYKEVYPHIDWVFYFNAAGKVEHDFVVRPGGKVSDIRLHYGGATSLILQKDGSLMANTPMGTVTESAPRSYTGKGAVASAYVLKGNTISFVTAPHKGTLVIDPTLEWGTLYGGTSDDFTPNLANDPQGNIYMSFATNPGHVSVNIVTSGAYQMTRQTYYDDASPFLVKFDSTGQRLWATHFGISQETLYPRVVPNISCDSFGNIFIMADTMLAKFNGAGQLSWAKGLPAYNELTYRVASIQCGAAGSIYMTGVAHSGHNAAFGTPGTYKDTVTGEYDAFLVKYDSAGTKLWGTFFGGEGSEQNYGGFKAIACDGSGNAYLAGRTQSLTGIATTGCHQNTFGGATDAFLAKFDGQGQLVWSTYYGGEAVENAGAVVVDQVGNVFLAANTTSETGISTVNSFQETLGGGNDFFIAKFNSNGERQWGTYYGGEGEDIYNYRGNILACDVSGNIVLYGFTNSPDGISTPGAYQDDILSGGYTVFLAKLSNAGQRVWGTYFGGAGGNQIGGYSMFYGPNSGGGDLSCDAFGNIYIANSAGPNASVTTPGSYPTTWGGGYQWAGGHDVFLAKFSDCSIVIPGVIAGDTAFCAGATAHFSIDPVPGASAYSWILPAGWQGSSTTDTIDATAAGNSGLVGVVVFAACGGSDTAWQQVTVRAPLSPAITRSGNELSTGTFTTYQWYKDNQPIAGATGATYTIAVAGSYTVKVTDAFGCVGTSAAFAVTTVGIDNKHIADGIDVFPNPASGLVHIASPVNVNVVLTGIDGRKIIEQKNAVSIDLSSYPESIYLLRITDTNDQLIKVVKLSKTK